MLIVVMKSLVQIYIITVDCWGYCIQLFDKEVKSFVYVLDGTAEKSKMQLPKDMKQGCKYSALIAVA